jgi:hypothetical protein
MLPHFTHFPLFFLSFSTLTHTLLLRPSQPYLFLFFIPLPHACTCNTQPARRVSFLSLILSHVINHLTAMCLSHGFIVIDCNCLQPITTFVGFHVCPLLETKHGLCAVCFSFIVCSSPLRTLQPKVLEISSVMFPSMFFSIPSPMPMSLCHLSSLLFIICTYSEISSAVS